MRFLIQTFQGRVEHDFSFELMKGCEFNNWKTFTEDFKYRWTDHKVYSNYIPVGSVEFVSYYLMKYYGLQPSPINIPEELMKELFLRRDVKYGTEKDVEDGKFVKSHDQIKGFVEILDGRNHVKPGNYLISEVVDIESEWRVFVYNGKIVGLQNYSGDFMTFPNIDMLKAMVMEYKNCPPAYTLDVGINKRGTFVIEVHDFFSCGLYGFTAHSILPFMFSRWFHWYIKQNK